MVLWHRLNATLLSRLSGQVKDVEVNHGMFVNTIEGLEAAGAHLQHVHFLSGAHLDANR